MEAEQYDAEQAKLQQAYVDSKMRMRTLAHAEVRHGYLKWQTQWWESEFERLQAATGMAIKFDSTPEELLDSIEQIVARFRDSQQRNDSLVGYLQQQQVEQMHLERELRRLRARRRAVQQEKRDEEKAVPADALQQQADAVWAQIAQAEARLRECFPMTSAGLRQIATAADFEERLQQKMLEEAAAAAPPRLRRSRTRSRRRARRRTRRAPTPTCSPPPPPPTAASRRTASRRRRRRPPARAAAAAAAAAVAHAFDLTQLGEQRNEQLDAAAAEAAGRRPRRRRGRAAAEAAASGGGRGGEVPAMPQAPPSVSCSPSRRRSRTRERHKLQLLEHGLALLQEQVQTSPAPQSTSRARPPPARAIGAAVPRPAAAAAACVGGARQRPRELFAQGHRQAAAVARAAAKKEEALRELAHQQALEEKASKGRSLGGNTIGKSRSVAARPAAPTAVGGGSHSAVPRDDGTVSCLSAVPHRGCYGVRCLLFRGVACVRLAKSTFYSLFEFRFSTFFIFSLDSRFIRPLQLARVGAARRQALAVGVVHSALRHVGARRHCRPGPLRGPSLAGQTAALLLLAGRLRTPKAPEW